MAKIDMCLVSQTKNTKVISQGKKKSYTKEKGRKKIPMNSHVGENIHPGVLPFVKKYKFSHSRVSYFI